MKVTVLLENRTTSSDYKFKHGLSLYIETTNHKILFDTGVDKSFAYNAQKLGVNLEDVDTVVISHGHYDHGGGLETFFRLNNKARVFIGKGAFDIHLAKRFWFIKHNIGLKKELLNSGRFVFTESIMRLDDELTLFGDIKGDKLIPKGNDRLLKDYGKGLIKKDDFQHEINLLVNENGKNSLFSGCSHRGIINIVEKAKDISKSGLNTVVGGFHLMGIDVKDSNDKAFLDELSDALSKNNINKYYTCHCTGEQPYKYLCQKVNNLGELKTGTVVEI